MATTTSFTYQAVPGFFRHDEEITGPQFRATTLPGLGLINRPYETDTVFDPEGKKTQWERFVHFLEHQNRLGRGKVLHKLVFLIRHGEGHHNVKEAEVGRHAWDSYWSLLDGDEQSTWSDARLTEKGKQQAGALNAFWRGSIENEGIPPPQRYYTSPLARCLETTRITYSGLSVPPDQPFKPIVKERMRERNGEHTCDRRSTRSWIASNYPGYEIENGLTENDEEWKPDWRETEDEIADRVGKLLDDIFSNEDKAILSFTAHSGLIRSLYNVTSHRDVWVSAGAMVPVLIKAEVVK
ncbi:phosphoglycerate mutase-like protein [Hypoxylon crocopeplum]|nr:phosphoglycerate mutase-like protein [Hypoxylon crocopeplum]